MISSHVTKDRTKGLFDVGEIGRLDDMHKQ